MNKLDEFVDLLEKTYPPNDNLTMIEYRDHTGKLSMLCFEEAFPYIENVIYTLYENNTGSEFRVDANPKGYDFTWLKDLI